MALKKISKEHNIKLIEQAGKLTVLTEKKVWEQELLERYIDEGIERDNKKLFTKKQTK